MGRTRRAPRAILALGAVQAGYYVVTGALPLVSMPGFERLTGPKTDDWLVRTIGGLAVGLGAVLARDAATGRTDPIVGLAGAVPFGLSSLWYGATGRVSRVYLLDGVVEAAFAAAWVATLRRNGSLDARSAAGPDRWSS